MFFAKINKSCLITYLGMVFACFSMYYSFVVVDVNNLSTIKMALICLMCAGVCDMFDGKFARMCKRTEEEKEFGVQLDSLADTFCFLATPVVFMLSLNMTEIYQVLIYAFFIICGVSRLGYFNINASLDSAVNIYKGLPVTSTAIIYPLLGMLYKYISLSSFTLMYTIVTLLVSLLMILNIKIPKLKGIWYVIIPILGLVLGYIFLVL